MSRTILEIPLKTNNIDAVLSIISRITYASGFVPQLLDGESVWCKDDGIMIKLQCFSAIFTGHSVIMNAWTRDAITGESDLEGFVSSIPKKKMKVILEKIQTEIQRKEL